jgi:signal transduction histidine kinase
VAATGSDAGGGRRRGLSTLPRRLSLRLRLTLLYGTCFILASAGVLAITYGLVARDSSGQTERLSASAAGVTLPDTHQSAEPAGRSAGASGSGGGGLRQTIVKVFPTGTEVITWSSSGAKALTRTTRKPPLGAGPNLNQIASAVQQQLDGIVAHANGALTSQRSRSLGSLLMWSGVALGVMAIVSILLGWLLAGRALRPLRTMTSRAREITAESLHERLAVDAREDELGDLATTFDGVLSRLERAFDAQKRFVANASHELRTPVTLERALLEVALADPDADAPDLRHACERVLAATAQQERMIEALLALARSQGGTDIDAPVNLADLAEDAITLREQRLDDIAVATDLHPAPLNGDPTLLERLVANLVENAIVHNRAEDGWITVETGQEATSSWLCVSNSGPDVPEGMISEIFEPFRRMDGERTATATGVGLGLSIVRAIADVHGATIDAGPVDGGGLRVRVRF